jgi:hypothetical protein
MKRKNLVVREERPEWNIANKSDILSKVHKSLKIRILYLQHAVRQMSRLDRMITTADVRHVVEHGEVIEDYPDDARGHSCLILGSGKYGRVIHVVCAPKDEYLAIITAYVPDTKEWVHGCRERKVK